MRMSSKSRVAGFAVLAAGATVLAGCSSTGGGGTSSSASGTPKQGAPPASLRSRAGSRRRFCRSTRRRRTRRRTMHSSTSSTAPCTTGGRTTRSPSTRMSRWPSAHWSAAARPSPSRSSPGSGPTARASPRRTCCSGSTWPRPRPPTAPTTPPPNPAIGAKYFPDNVDLGHRLRPDPHDEPGQGLQPDLVPGRRALADHPDAAGLGRHRRAAPRAVARPTRSARTPPTKDRCTDDYTYLSKQSTNGAGYVGSPIWAVVDGPWKLKATTAPPARCSIVPEPVLLGPAEAVPERGRLRRRTPRTPPSTRT